MSVEFKPNSAGIQALMKSKRMQAVLRAKAEAVRARAGEGFDVQVTVGRTRARATVSAATLEAKRRQAREHALERAVGGGV